MAQPRSCFVQRNLEIRQSNLTFRCSIEQQPLLYADCPNKLDRFLKWSSFFETIPLRLCSLPQVVYEGFVMSCPLYLGVTALCFLPPAAENRTCQDLSTDISFTKDKCSDEASLRPRLVRNYISRK